MKSAILYALLAAAVLRSSARTVLLHDPSQKYLQGSLIKEPRFVSQAAAASTLAAAGSLLPPYKVDRSAATQADTIVQHDIFQKPKAVVLLHIGGISSESGIVATLEESLGHGHTVRLDVQDEGRPASAGSILQATSDLIRANPEAPITVLDHSALQGCRPGICMAGHLATAARRCGGKLHTPPQQSATGGLRGQLELPGLVSPLDLSHPAARLFGIELAGLQGSLQQEMQRLQERPQEEQEPMLYESTFVGLQGLSALHPQGSPELAAAEDALFSLIGSLAEQMKQAYDNEVLYQVALLGDAPVSAGDAANLMGWKEVSRRALLERTGGRNLLQAPGEAALGKKFANKATAYAVTLILIWFTFAGVYCMVSMHFKQDTLLYGRSKTD